MKKLLTLILFAVSLAAIPALAQSELAEPRYLAYSVADSLAQHYKLSEGRLIQLRKVEAALTAGMPIPAFAKNVVVNDSETARYVEALFHLRQRYAVALYRAN